MFWEIQIRRTSILQRQERFGNFTCSRVLYEDYIPKIDQDGSSESKLRKILEKICAQNKAYWYQIKASDCSSRREVTYLFNPRTKKGRLQIRK